MRPCSITFYLAALCAFALPAFAADTAQIAAETLLDRARQLSDIRRPNAPPFRLKASFSFIGDQLETFEGTYVEMWASDTQWRREITVKDMRRVEVGGPNRRWLLETGRSLPQQGERIPRIVEMFPPGLAKLEFETLENETSPNLSAKCAIAKPIGEHKARNALCFEEKSGALIESVTPEFIHERTADYSCAYGMFQKFGNQLVPYEADCRLNGHRQLEVHIEEIVAQTFTDQTPFNPPEGAIELGRCSSGGTPPVAQSTPDPIFPAGQREISTWVNLRLIVDAKGKPQNVQVVRSGGKTFDEMAAGAVRRWIFKPATCEAKPVSVQIEVEVPFRSR